MRRIRHRAKIAPPQLIAEAVYKGNVQHQVSNFESRAYNLPIPNSREARQSIDEGLHQIIVRT